jgi:hypothetical protein
MGSVALLVMGKSVDIVSSMLPGVGDIDLFFSYGDVIPDLSGYDKTFFWMSGVYAFKLQKVGLAKNLCSPGASWLSGISVEYTGRRVITQDVSELEPFVGERWVKPAEAKIPSFVSATYNYSAVQQKIVENNLVSGLALQWTNIILDIDLEHRFFVADGEVVTGSPYRVHGELFNPDIDWSYLAEAERFLKNVLKDIKTPPACSIDVGFDHISERWVVIEANRAWSSGFYGCDPAATLEVVALSSEYDGVEWLWKPDEHIVLLNKGEPLLDVVPVDSGSSGFIKYFSDK